MKKGSLNFVFVEWDGFTLIVEQELLVLYFFSLKRWKDWLNFQVAASLLQCCTERHLSVYLLHANKAQIDTYATQRESIAYERCHAEEQATDFQLFNHYKPDVLHKFNQVYKGNRNWKSPSAQNRHPKYHYQRERMGRKKLSENYCKTHQESVPCHHAVNMFWAENPIRNSIFGSEKVNQIKFIIVQSVECKATGSLMLRYTQE